MSDDKLTWQEYQTLTEATAAGYAQSGDGVSRNESIFFLALAINGEAGEVAEKVKKWKREENEEYLDDLEKELGDVLWYVARLADEMDLNLEDVADNNIDKLMDRAERDQIFGEGDHR